MELLTPSIGLFFWMLVCFLSLFFILKKYAWTPILSGIQARENFIDDALKSAERAKNEMAALTATNEKLLIQAGVERDAILKEARDAKDMIIVEAKGKATEEADRIIQQTREVIQNEKMAAVTELKNQVAQLSLEVSQKLMRKELANDQSQKDLANQLLAEITQKVTLN